MKIIAISGRRGTGKTALADYLCKKHGFVKVSFAEEIRRVARSLIPFTEADFHSPSKKEAKFHTYEWSPRDFLIRLGEFMRYHDEDYWVNVALNRLKSETGKYVIDDLRFKNEAKVLKGIDAVLVRVNRYVKNNPYGKNLDIPSETDLDEYEFDYVVHDSRNGPLAELQGHASKILEVV